MFVVYDYQGPRNTGLFAAYCALAKVPLALTPPRLGWTDHLNPRRLGLASVAWFADALHAFFGAADQAIRFEAYREGAHIVVRGLARPRTFQQPVATEAILVPGRGVARLSAVVGDRTLDVTWEAVP